jgi:hypothetical protein
MPAGITEGQHDVQDGACPWRAVQGEPAAERLHTVPQPDQSGAAAEGGAATPVIAHQDSQHALADGHLDLRGGGAGVLDGIGQRLGHHVVGGDLGQVRQPLRHLHVEADRDGGLAGQRPERRAQPARGEGGRVKAAGDLTQFLQRASQPGDHFVHQLGRLGGLGR